MAKHPQALTANRLHDGEVVYLTKDRLWSTEFASAEIAETDDTAKELLAFGLEACEEGGLLDPYLFDVKREGTAVQPIKVREIIRAKGPTVRTDLGKQAA